MGAITPRGAKAFAQRQPEGVASGCVLHAGTLHRLRKGSRRRQCRMQKPAFAAGWMRLPHLNCRV
jgi:hypothetical protein